jgi:predicted nucleotidyltransferase
MRVELHQDYRDFVRALVDASADFVIVGGWAVAVHGHGRATDDLDVFIRASPGNAAAVMCALRAFGAPLAQHGVTVDTFATPGLGYRMGRVPVLIEVLTRISGVDFDEALVGALEVDLGGVRARVIGREALIRNKRAAGRAKDVADIEALARGAAK